MLVLHRVCLVAEVCVYVCCRRGNDSQLAVTTLKKAAVEFTEQVKIKDIIGGLDAWANEDQTFPKY